MAKREASVPYSRQKKKIRYYSHYSRDWESLIPLLRNYQLKSVGFLSIAGDAPKDFIMDREYRPGHRNRRQRRERYIAKLGSKFYPNESITEQLITRLGQTFQINIADSKLRIVAGQVRFMSKYFLDRQNEQLTHGAEIFEVSLGKENYAQLANKKVESDYFTFQITRETIQEAFPGFEEDLISGFVEMLAFDALIGHNDRHPYNWGVIVPIHKRGVPRFAPIFDILKREELGGRTASSRDGVLPLDESRTSSTNKTMSDSQADTTKRMHLRLENASIMVRTNGGLMAIKKFIEAARTWLAMRRPVQAPHDKQARFHLTFGDLLIGTLSVENGVWKFEYSDEFKQAGSLRPLIEFPDVNESYRSEDLWQFFASRIPSTEQAEVEAILRDENISEDDAIGLLKRFGTRTIKTHLC